MTITKRSDDCTLELPSVREDVVLKNKDGVQRIGRLSHSGKHFELSSYGAKYSYLWKIDDVVAWKRIEYIKE